MMMMIIMIIIFSDTQNISSIPISNLFNGNQEIFLEETNLEYEKSIKEDINLPTSDNIMNKTKSLKNFQADVESKLFLLEDVIISGKVATKETFNDKTSRFTINILKDRIPSLERVLKRIEYLTKQLLSRI